MIISRTGQDTSAGRLHACDVTPVSIFILSVESEGKECLLSFSLTQDLQTLQCPSHMLIFLMVTNLASNEVKTQEVRPVREIQDWKFLC